VVETDENGIEDGGVEPGPGPDHPLDSE
jgi:hypothetical protein